MTTPFRLFHSPRHKVVLIGTALVLIGGGILVVQAIANQQKLAEQTRLSRTAEAAKHEQQRQATDAEQYEEAKAAAEKSAGADNATASGSQVKYATSSDPRSTAYSTTPPKPHPASFSIKITHNGQLAAGDVVYYNATKGEKGYYNGDLKLSPATVTISRSGLRYASITVSSPTSKLIAMPSDPWDDHSPYFGIAFLGTKAPAPALSHNMVVDTYNMPPNGTYQLHITAGCGDGSSDGCQSDAFITVIVVD